MTRKKYDVVFPLREFTTQDGQTKTQWLNCGAVFERDGKFSLKLDALPASVPADGLWLQLFAPKPREQQAPRQAPPPADDFGDEVPF